MSPNPSDAELLMELRDILKPIKAEVRKQPNARPTPEQTAQVARQAKHIYDTLRARYDVGTAISLMQEVWNEK